MGWREQFPKSKAWKWERGEKYNSTSEKLGKDTNSQVTPVNIMSQ